MRHLHPAAVDVLESQKHALAQLLGALLFQTEADATGIDLDGHPLPACTVEWARQFRKELEARQPELLQAVRRHTCFLNTHPGFALRPLLEQPTALRPLSAVYTAIDALAADYAAGVGDAVNADDFALVFGAALTSVGHDPELVRFALEQGGLGTLALAAGKRMVKRLPQDAEPHGKAS